MDLAKLDQLWVLSCAGWVFTMQAGFLCLESGLIGSKNAINVAFKNMVDFCIALVLFWLVGFGLMFGNSWYGLFGTTMFAVELEASNVAITIPFIFQAMFCGVAATILSGAAAGRMRCSAYMIATVITSGFIYPWIGHWTWGGTLGGQPGWLAVYGFRDFAGSTVVHGVGAAVGLAAVIIIGPRIGRFNPDGSVRKYSGHNIPMAMLGTLILWGGWIAFNAGSTGAFNAQVPSIIVKTLLAGSAGFVTSYFVSLVLFKHASITCCINGSLAGLVSITAGCHCIGAGASLLVGGIGAIAMLLVEKGMEKLQWDDSISAVPVHGAGGIWGTIAVGIFGNLEILGTGLTRLEQIYSQCLGALVCFSCSFVLSYLAFKIIHRFHPLRVCPNTELLGLNVAEHGSSTELFDLLTEMENQRRSGDFSSKVHVEADSEVGQVAEQYNRVLEKVNSTTQYAIKMADEAELARWKAEQSACELQQSEAELRLIFDAAGDGILTFNAAGEIASINTAAAAILGFDSEIPAGLKISDCIPFSMETWEKSVERNSVQAVHERQVLKQEIAGKRRDGSMVPLELAISQVKMNASHLFVAVLRDLTEAKRLQFELAQAHKLESVGQLAAGIAHEINTPTQFVGDNIQFLRDGFGEIDEVLMHVEKLLVASESANLPPEVVQEIQEAFEDADLDYLRDEIPLAIKQSLEGVERIGKIVRAMKEFSHPGSDQKSPLDLHRLLQTTITVAHNEWKYVAEVHTEFDENVPEILGLPGELNQVFLNLIVNAAHAIADTQMGDEPDKGSITIGTRKKDDIVEIFIRDSGTGIPEHVKQRIFDPFFTTKSVGKGTGQGLAIARSVIVDKHQGELFCESEVGAGSTFIIRLPITVQPEVNEAEYV